MADKSRFRKFAGYRWEGIENSGYAGVKDQAAGSPFRGAEKYIVFGAGESVSFQQRYFELAPGGHSRLEKHTHAHCVLGLRGKGTLIMGREVYELAFMDAAYISPGTPHQLVNDSEEPFGFFCTVDAERDEPRPIEGDELAALREHPLVGERIRTGTGAACDVRSSPRGGT